MSSHFNSQFDWRQLGPPPALVPRVSPRGRLRWLTVGCWLCLFAVLARGMQLEIQHGSAYRAEVRKLLSRERPLPAARGKIFAHDGSVLAIDQELAALAVHYRYLQTQPDATWLTNQARQRLPNDQRRNRDALARAADELRVEVAELNAQLALLCHVPLSEWLNRRARIEERVERIAASVNRRRWHRFAESQNAAADQLVPETPPWWNIIANLPDAMSALSQPGEVAWQAVTVQEQTDYHIVLEDLSTEEADQLAAQFANHPAVRLLHVPRRTYPQGPLAANLLGFVGQETQGPLALVRGRQGVEKRHDPALTGRPGLAIEKTTRWGQVMEYRLARSSRPGGNVRLTINAAWQRTAETLLDHTLTRLPHVPGGAVVVIDLANHKPRVLATAPRFDPNHFAQANGAAIEQILSAPDKPLFDRSRQMQLSATDCLQSLLELAPTSADHLFEPLVPRDASFLTPCQLAQVMAALATDGGYAQVHWVDTATASFNQAQAVSAADLFNRQRLNASHAELARLRAALERHHFQTDDHPHPLADAVPPVAAIDGLLTSQAGPPHSWCAGLVPRQQPRYAFVVVVEQGGGTRHLAASIARKLIARLSQKTPPQLGMRPATRR